MRADESVTKAPEIIRARRGLAGSGTRIVTLVVLVYLVAGPLIMLVVTTFQDTSKGVVIRPPFPWTFANITTIVASPSTYRVLGATAIFTVGALLLSFILSCILAWLIERTDLPARNTVFVLIVAPQGIPKVILAIAWSLLLNPTNGFLNTGLRSLGLGGDSGPFNVYTMPWMIIVEGIAMVPLTFLLIAPALRTMNANYEEAARTSGATPATIIRKITLPLLKPALLGALIYEFVNVVETVDVPLLLGVPGKINVLSTTIYYASHPVVGLGNYGISSGYGALLLIIALLPLIMYNKMISQASSFVTVTGKSFRPRRSELGKWKPLALIFTWGYIFVSLVLPVLVLVWTSTQPYITPIGKEALSRFTLNGYRSTIGTGLFSSALKNTVIVGLSAALMAMVLSVSLSWIIVRSKSKLRVAADVLAFLPHAMPAVVIGLAIMIIYLVLPIPVYGTIWIIVIALGTQYISLGTRLTVGGMTQIHASLEEAAFASGAPMRQVWRRVLLPLLRPVVANGFLMVFLSSIQNLTLPLMLFSTGNVVMATLIYQRWDIAGQPTTTAVLSVIMITVTIIATLFMRQASDKKDLQA